MTSPEFDMPSKKRIVLWTVAAVAAMAAIAVVIFAIRWYTAEPRGALDAREVLPACSSRCCRSTSMSLPESPCARWV